MNSLVNKLQAAMAARRAAISKHGNAFSHLTRPACQSLDDPFCGLMIDDHHDNEDDWSDDDN
jgi:hypothetical protein